MGIEVIIQFPDKATVLVLAYIKNLAGALVDPTAITTTIYDPSDVQKAGYISVTASASFTAGLVVTGTTSGATGLVISKPDGTTLELQQVTGVWASGEGITDTGSGTSTTSSALLGADMAQHDATTGVYEYFYHLGLGVDPMDKGEWRGDILVADGTGIDTVYSPGSFGFAVK